MFDDKMKKAKILLIKDQFHLYLTEKEENGDPINSNLANYVWDNVIIPICEERTVSIEQFTRFCNRSCNGGALLDCVFFKDYFLEMIFEANHKAPYWKKQGNTDIVIKGSFALHFDDLYSVNVVGMEMNGMIKLADGRIIEKWPKNILVNGRFFNLSEVLKLEHPEVHARYVLDPEIDRYISRPIFVTEKEGDDWYVVPGSGMPFQGQRFYGDTIGAACRKVLKLMDTSGSDIWNVNVYFNGGLCKIKDNKPSVNGTCRGYHHIKRINYDYGIYPVRDSQLKEGVL